MSNRYVSYEAVRPNDEDLAKVASDICQVAHETYSQLVRNYPQIGVTNTDVTNKFTGTAGRSAPAEAHFERALRGETENRQGVRRSRVYIARETSGAVIGWLTTAEDYSNNPLKKRMRSYLWLVNGGVHPDMQRKGVMSTLLLNALTDPNSPHILSKERFVTAYPPVVEKIELPVVSGLHRLDILPTDPPFMDDGLFGVDIALQRHQGPSPEAVAMSLKGL